MRLSKCVTLSRTSLSENVATRLGPSPRLPSRRMVACVIAVGDIVMAMSMIDTLNNVDSMAFESLPTEANSYVAGVVTSAFVVSFVAH